MHLSMCMITMYTEWLRKANKLLHIYIYIYKYIYIYIYIYVYNTYDILAMHSATVLSNIANQVRIIVS